MTAIYCCQLSFISVLFAPALSACKHHNVDELWLCYGFYLLMNGVQCILFQADPILNNVILVMSSRLKHFWSWQSVDVNSREWSGEKVFQELGEWLDSCIPTNSNEEERKKRTGGHFGFSPMLWKEEAGKLHLFLKWIHFARWWE